jgi:hypothetical protein
LVILQENMREGQIVAPLSLFYSYSYEDETLRDQLEKHLHQLQRQGLISAWHDRKILAGETRGHEIDTHLETASLILLLVSPDFLASDYCYEKQMQHALERHRRGETRVVPIILRPCDWQHSPLKDLQCLPHNGRPVTQWQDQDEAFHAITQDLRRIIEQQQAPAHPPAPLSPLDRQNRMRILRQVRAIWIDGLLTQSLHHAARIELSLQDRPDVLANPWRLQVQELDQAPQTLPDGTSIVQVYDGASGELLILGEPGAGKTTLLLELTRTLLERAEQDERLPMPIVFHLSSWAEKRQSLNKWLVEELSTKYQVPRKVGRRWIDTDQVLPLLDGLDEMAEDARSACVRQINGYYQARLAEQGNSSIVVCCRSEEYATLSTHITFQHAVSILPLTDEQIDAYLGQAGEQVKALQQALNEDTELHSLARQPLMLTIFTFAYQDAQASEVTIGATSNTTRRTIFARYVEHMLKRRGQSRRWKPAQVIGCLMFLAKQMQQHNQTVLSVENLQPTWLSKMWKILYRCCIGLVLWLVIGSFLELFWQSNGPVDTLIVALIGAILLIAVVDTRISPAETLTWSWKEAQRGLVLGLIVGLVMGSIMGLMIGFFIAPLGGLISGLYMMLAVVLAGVLASTLSGKQLPERLSLAPNEGIWHSSKNGLLLLLVSWLFFILFFGVDYVRISWPFSVSIVLFVGPSHGFVALLVLAMFAALMSLPFFGLGAFIKHFILRFLLALRGDLPWNLVAFLNEATERLLLRRVGGSYIFVHRTLQDYFAELGDNNVTT